MDRYEEAMSRCKQWEREHTNGYVIQDMIEFIFPELAESEDERIRKSIIAFLRAQRFVPNNQADILNGWIAYLEKQKECSFCDFPKSCADCPKEIQAAIDKEFGIDGRDDNDNPLNGYGDWKKGMVLNGPAIWGLVKLGTELHKEQPAEWSSVDELKLQTIEAVIVRQKGSAAFGGFLPEELIDWLKSLCPRPCWMPSMDEMEALNEAINEAAASESMHENDWRYNSLRSLRERIKKVTKQV